MYRFRNVMSKGLGSFLTRLLADKLDAEREPAVGSETTTAQQVPTTTQRDGIEQPLKGSSTNVAQKTASSSEPEESTSFEDFRFQQETEAAKLLSLSDNTAVKELGVISSPYITSIEIIDNSKSSNVGSSTAGVPRLVQWGNSCTPVSLIAIAEFVKRSVEPVSGKLIPANLQNAVEQAHRQGLEIYRTKEGDGWFETEVYQNLPEAIISTQAQATISRTDVKLRYQVNFEKMWDAILKLKQEQDITSLERRLGRFFARFRKEIAILELMDADWSGMDETTFVEKFTSIKNDEIDSQVNDFNEDLERKLVSLENNQAFSMVVDVETGAHTISITKKNGIYYWYDPRLGYVYHTNDASQSALHALVEQLYLQYSDKTGPFIEICRWGLDENQRLIFVAEPVAPAEQLSTSLSSGLTHLPEGLGEPPSPSSSTLPTQSSAPDSSHTPANPASSSEQPPRRRTVRSYDSGIADVTERIYLNSLWPKDFVLPKRIQKNRTINTVAAYAATLKYLWKIQQGPEKSNGLDEETLQQLEMRRQNIEAFKSSLPEPLRAYVYGLYLSESALVDPKASTSATTSQSADMVPTFVSSHMALLNAQIQADKHTKITIEKTSQDLKDNQHLNPEKIHVALSNNQLNYAFLDHSNQRQSGEIAIDELGISPSKKANYNRFIATWSFHGGAQGVPPTLNPGEILSVGEQLSPPVIEEVILFPQPKPRVIDLGDGQHLEEEQAERARASKAAGLAIEEAIKPTREEEEEAERAREAQEEAERLAHEAAEKITRASKAAGLAIEEAIARRREEEEAERAREAQEEAERLVPEDLERLVEAARLAAEEEAKRAREDEARRREEIRRAKREAKAVDVDLDASVLFADEGEDVFLDVDSDASVGLHAPMLNDKSFDFNAFRQQQATGSTLRDHFGDIEGVPLQAGCSYGPINCVPNPSNPSELTFEYAYDDGINASLLSDLYAQDALQNMRSDARNSATKSLPTPRREEVICKQVNKTTEHHLKGTKSEEAPTATRCRLALAQIGHQGSQLHQDKGNLPRSAVCIITQDFSDANAELLAKTRAFEEAIHQGVLPLLAKEDLAKVCQKLKTDYQQSPGRYQTLMRNLGTLVHGSIELPANSIVKQFIEKEYRKLEGLPVPAKQAYPTLLGAAPKPQILEALQTQYYKLIPPEVRLEDVAGLTAGG